MDLIFKIYKMKLLKIPENVTELTSYLEFVQTIIEVNKFNDNIFEFFKKILFDEFLKSVKDWKLTASKKDLKYLNTLDDDITLFYDYSKNKFIFIESDIRCKKYIVINKNNIKKIYPNESGLGMLIEFKKSYKEHKWPGWLPTFHNTTIYEIDLLKKSVELKSTNLTETSNGK